MKKSAKVTGIVVGLIVIISVAVLPAMAKRNRGQGQFFFGSRDVSFFESGEVLTEPVTDWSFANDFPVIRIRTTSRFGIPYWVTTYMGGEGSHLYIFSHYEPGLRFPEARGWNRNLLRDPRMHIKIGNQMFAMRAHYVTDPKEYAEASEIFYRRYDRLIARGLRDDHGHTLVPVREEQTWPDEKRPRLHFFRLEQELGGSD